MATHKPNHVCKVCGTPYYACESCEKHNTYKTVCESENHYKIYNIVVLYLRKLYTKQEAKNALSDCDLSDIDSYKESIVRVVNEIKKEDTKPIQRRAKEVSAKNTKTDFTIKKENDSFLDDSDNK